MNAQLAPVPQTDPDPRSALETSLKAAQRREAAAVESLAAADRDLERKQALVRSCEHDAEQSSTAIAANDDLAAAEHLANLQRTAEVRLTTARNMLTKSKSARDLAHGEVQNAQRARVQIARQLVMLKAQASYQDCLRAWERFNELRSEVLAAYRVFGGEAVTPQQALVLDRPTFTLAELGLNPPELHIPLDKLQDRTFGLPQEDRCREDRARVNECAQRLTMELQRLARGIDTNSGTPS